MIGRTFELVSIDDEPFHADPIPEDHIRYEVLPRKQTATVKIHDKNDDPQIIKLGYTTPEEIFDDIKHGRDINLNKAFVQNFSIDDYRKANHISDDEEIILNHFQAANSIWITDNEVKEKVKFDGCTFGSSEGETDFRVSFYNFKANFSVSFVGCKFKASHVDFVGSEVDYTLYFDNADFSGSFDISQALIASLSFDGAHFHEGSFRMCSCIITGYEFDFKETDFGNLYVTFNNIEITRDMEWNWWRVKSAGSVIYVNSIIDGYLELQFSTCNELCIQHCSIQSTLSISVEEEKKLKHLSFYKTTNDGHIYIDSRAIVSRIDASRAYIHEDDADTNSDLTPRASRRSEIASQYVLLKENYANIGYYELEDYCYVKLMRHQRAGKKGMIRKTGEWFFKDLLGQYGTNWVSILLAIPIVIMLWGCLFYLLPNIGFNTPKSIWNAIYVSGITFFTIGFGDITPVNTLSKMLCILEGFNGVFLVSYFTICFARKTIR